MDVLWEQVYRDVIRSPRAAKQVDTYLRSIKMRAHNVQYKLLSDDLLAILYYVIHGSFPDHDEDARADRWVELRRNIGETSLDISWLVLKKGYLSNALDTLLHKCKRERSQIQGCLFVKEATHNGTPIGFGLFSLINVLRGQCLLQFTGSVHKPDNMNRYLEKNDGRANYCIQAFYGLDEYIINPLVSNDTEVGLHNVAAYINEPSPPPWQNGDIVRSGRNNVLVKKKVADSYEVEYASGKRNTVHATDLTWPDATQLSFESNCLWYDFPVPCDELYRPTGGRFGRDYVYERTETDECVLRWSLREASRAFTHVVLDHKRQKLTPDDIVYLTVDDVLILHDDVFRGLNSYARVVEWSGDDLLVRHTVAMHTVWRLPKIIRVGKYQRCASCERHDDAACTKCTVVPFPLIFACKNIKRGEELLCLYSKRSKSRGLPCTSFLDEHTMLPMWNELYDVPQHE